MDNPVLSDQTFERDRRGIAKPTPRNFFYALRDPELCGFEFRRGPGGNARARRTGADEWQWVSLEVISQIRFRLAEHGFVSMPKGLIRDAARMAALDAACRANDFSDLA